MTTAQRVHKQLLSLFPSGRAFKFPYMGTMWRLLRAISLTYGSMYAASLNVYDGMFPDNDNFTTTDASNWERALGMITNSSVSLTDRKAAILRKMAHPGGQPARQHYLYIESQLRAAGFDVYVYENRFLAGSPATRVTKTPGEVLGITTSLSIYGDFEYNEAAYGESWADDGISIIANHLEESEDLYFDFGANLRSTFFIAGATISTFANVSADRKTEFRELILRLKPAQTAGFLFINYV